jgi:hypothetical protein
MLSVFKCRLVFMLKHVVHIVTGERTSAYKILVLELTGNSIECLVPFSAEFVNSW